MKTVTFLVLGAINGAVPMGLLVEVKHRSEETGEPMAELLRQAVIDHQMENLKGR